MTNDQRDVYMLLLMAGRESEALEYRDKCNEKKEED